MYCNKSIAIAAILAAAAVGRSNADEAFSLVIDPFTGAAELRNDSDAAVDLDGYFVTSAADPVLDPVAWNSLTEQGELFYETFSETGNRLGEVSLFGSVSIAGGSSLPIGSPYTPFSPSAIGEVEPGLDSMQFSYTLADASDSLDGDVEFSARNTVVLVVDPATGAGSLTNQSAFDIDLDSYLIISNQDVLDPSGWAPLSSGDSDWFSSTGAANRLTEGNLFGSTALPSGASLDLGVVADPGLLNDETDLSLSFTALGIDAIDGGVLFGSAVAVDFDSDFNGDGVVDVLDLDILGTNFNMPGDASTGDANDDGVVDVLDLDILGGEFGAGAGALAASVVSAPEPSGVLLVGLFSLAALTRRRK